MPSIDAKIKKIQADLADAIKERDQERARKKFKCCCGDMHAIKECVVVQTYWYTSPHGCTGGDYWNVGELQIICPTTKVRNRVLFESQYTIPYDIRFDFNYNAEAQFKRMYKDLFKAIVDDYGETRDDNFNNNYYFDKNHAKFGINLKAVK